MASYRQWFGRGLDQDYVDSINSFWTVLLLTVCSVGSFVVRYTTTPISCWCPAYFTGPMFSYTQESCFLKDLYHNKSVMDNDDDKIFPASVPSYHLWIPLILFFQALAFKVPNIIWNSTKDLFTFNMEETVESLKSVQVTNAENRQAIFSDAARVFASLLRRNRIFLSLLYLFVKLLSCVNLAGQLMFLTIYFRQYLAIRIGTSAGIDMDSIIKPLLVKHVFCYFQVRILHNTHSHRVQCSLPITEIYEKMFIFLWYLVFLLAVITILNLVLWAGFLFLPFLRDGRIAAHVNAAKGSPPDEHSITRFISGFLGMDGVLVLTMMSRNSSELVAAGLTQHLYQVFREKEEEFKNQRNLYTEEPRGGVVFTEATRGVAALPMSDLSSGARPAERAPVK
ncbi:innexin unc-9-like isoform X2 [Haliotis rubra]|uniref:innexin unc-9-like isoform X2 n=1 Tax=Haliotis rubra TaxID=36100 RepID=UPI001EE5F6E4|nr:innexin unc-9-like isoform X2 [Haliotis rubra]